jgi:hypothetical protein
VAKLVSGIVLVLACLAGCQMPQPRVLSPSEVEKLMGVEKGESLKPDDVRQQKGIGR